MYCLTQVCVKYPCGLKIFLIHDLLFTYTIKKL